MGLLEKASTKISQWKTINPTNDRTPEVEAFENSGAVTVATTGSLDPDYDPTNKKNPGAITIGTLQTVYDSDNLQDTEKHVPDGYKPHIFEDPKVADYYQNLYNEVNYEGKDYFDPSFNWTVKEEKKLVRKTEWRVMVWAFIMFFALDVDRFNLQNAVAGSLFKDVHITQDDYNLGNTINSVCFLAAEIPSQLISKKLGPDVWIPIQMVAWSLVSIFQSFIKNKSGFLATRALIGALEGGFIPDVTLWMSYFYTGKELSVRMGYFYMANSATQAVSGLLAFGIQHLNGRGGWAGWRYIFMIEGLLTLVIGIASFFAMPPSVVQTRARWRPNGWYTPREEKIMVNRILRDDPSKGDMNNREAITPRLIFKSILDWHMWPIYWARLFQDIAGLSISRYMAIILKSMKFSTLNIDLLLIPSNIGTIITMLANVYLCQYTGSHSLAMLITAIWLTPCLAAMRWWKGFQVHKWGSYALLVTTLSYPPPQPITSSWVSANANSVRTRTIAAAILNVHSQAAAIIGSNMLRADDAPKYHRASAQLFAIALASGVLVGLTRIFYWYVNKKRQAEWDALNTAQQVEYLEHNRNGGNKRLDFRFVS